MITHTGTATGTGPPAAERDRRPQALLLTASAVSIAGNVFSLVGVAWFVLQSTGSPARAGVVAFASSVPVVLAAVLGGPLIDLVGHVRASVLSDLVCALATGAIPLLYATGGLAFWQLVTLAALAGLFHAPGDTARAVLVPVLAARAGTTLTRATSVYESARACLVDQGGSGSGVRCGEGAPPGRRLGEQGAGASR